MCVSRRIFLPELVKRIKPSSVAIETSTRKATRFRAAADFSSPPTGSSPTATLSKIRAASRSILIDGKKFVVKGVLAIDGEGDLAMLQVDVPTALAIPLPIVRSVPQEGESIVVVGNPFGLEGSVSNGIVSAVREISGYGKIIQITAPISPGSSGSPVVNMYGQVIGIATLAGGRGTEPEFRRARRTDPPAQSQRAADVSSLTAETQKNKRSAAERFYSQGVAQLSRDDYARALQFFEKAAEIDPNYAEAWYQAGFCYGLLDAIRMRLKASRQAARLRPEWAEAFRQYRCVEFRSRPVQGSGRAYRQAMRIEDKPDTQYSLGLSLSKLNRTDEEILAYRRAIAMKPDHANALERLGAAYFKQKRYADSASTYEQLKTYKPDAKTYNALGESYLELNKPDDSLQAFNSALGYDPEFDKARYNLGRTYLKLGNTEMARVQYEILKNARSDWADRFYVLIEP